MIIRDRGFNQQLAERLEVLMRKAAPKATPDSSRRPTLWQSLRGFVVFHVLRHYPHWAGWLPAHAPTLVVMPAAAANEGAPERPDGP